jgi:hypothetical protein
MVKPRLSSILLSPMAMLVMQVGVMWVSMYETLMPVAVAVRFPE